MPYDQLRGLNVTRLGKRHKAEPVVKASNPHGETVYWVGAPGIAKDRAEAVRHYQIAAQADNVDAERML